MQYFVTCCFLQWWVVSPRPTTKLEDHPLSVVRDWFKYWCRLLRPQPEDAPCFGDTGPTLHGADWLFSWLIGWLIGRLKLRPQQTRKAIRGSHRTPISKCHSLTMYTSSVTAWVRSWYPSFPTVNATDGLLQFAKWPGRSGLKHPSSRNLYPSAPSSVLLFAAVAASHSSTVTLPLISVNCPWEGLDSYEVGTGVTLDHGGTVLTILPAALQMNTGVQSGYEEKWYTVRKRYQR
jgi:hypothetical protein